MKILILIPAYNEQDNISNVIERLTADEYAAYDLLVINDNSADATHDLIAASGVPHLDNPRRLGIGGTVQQGYKYARENDYGVAVQMDGDGQHDPRFLADVLEPIIAGKADYVIGSRFLGTEGDHSTFARRTGIRLLSSLIEKVTGICIKDVTSGFRAVNRPLIEKFADDYPQDYPEPIAICAALADGASIKEVPVSMNKRTGGSSSLRGFWQVKYMIKVSLGIIKFKSSFRTGRR